jgi:hypothetical protein
MPASPLLELAKGTLTTTSVALITVPANQLWEVKNIYLQQPTTAGAKVIAIGRGTLTTVADADAVISRNWVAGLQSENVFAPLALAAAATLDGIVSAGTTEVTYLIEGYKTLLV